MNFFLYLYDKVIYFHVFWDQLALNFFRIMLKSWGNSRIIVFIISELHEAVRRGEKFDEKLFINRRLVSCRWRTKWYFCWVRGRLFASPSSSRTPSIATTSNGIHRESWTCYSCVWISVFSRCSASHEDLLKQRWWRNSCSKDNDIYACAFLYRSVDERESLEQTFTSFCYSPRDIDVVRKVLSSFIFFLLRLTYSIRKKFGKRVIHRFSNLVVSNFRSTKNM